MGWIERLWSLGYMSLFSVTAKSLQSCPTLCDPIDSSPPGSSVHGIFQARTLEWVAISFFSAGKWKVRVKSLSCVWLLGTPWTWAYQALPSMGLSRQEYWSGLPLPSPDSIATRFLMPHHWPLNNSCWLGKVSNWSYSCIIQSHRQENLTS